MQEGGPEVETRTDPEGTLRLNDIGCVKSRPPK